MDLNSRKDAIDGTGEVGTPGTVGREPPYAIIEGQLQPRTEAHVVVGDQMMERLHATDEHAVGS